MPHYPRVIAFKATDPVADAIRDLATREHLSPADACRRIVVAGLRAHGIEPRTPAHHADQVVS